mgnify:CR=1 FL=1
MKFTKIVATVNASTCTPELLLALYKNGMDVVRFNTAHMEVGEMDRAVAMVRRVSDKIAIMVDTKGPNIRTANLTEPLALKQGDTVYMTGDAVEAPAGVQVNYPAFAAEVAPAGSSATTAPSSCWFWPARGKCSNARRSMTACLKTINRSMCRTSS